MFIPESCMCPWLLQQVPYDQSRPVQHCAAPRALTCTPPLSTANTAVASAVHMRHGHCERSVRWDSTSKLIEERFVPLHSGGPLIRVWNLRRSRRTCCAGAGQGHSSEGPGTATAAAKCLEIAEALAARWVSTRVSPMAFVMQLLSPGATDSSWKFITHVHHHIRTHR